MIRRVVLLGIVCVSIGACAAKRDRTPLGSHGAGGSSVRAASQPATCGGGTAPLAIGESFAIESRVLRESRPIHVFAPTVYGQRFEQPLPVLYVLDGGLNEDFLHIAGLVQVLVCNGGMRPFLVVGIPNTARRRDMSGPTTSAEDRKMAPVVGRSGTFRRFVREELIPAIRSRYRTTAEAAIVGESLAGLFVLETFFLEPGLFETYVAVDPSLWWANEELLSAAGSRLRSALLKNATIYVASSGEPVSIDLCDRLARAFRAHRNASIRFEYATLPAETHQTVYHAAALGAFRSVFAPRAVDR